MTRWVKTTAALVAGAAFLLLLVGAFFVLEGRWRHARTVAGESPHKVYVILGFHTNFYHSWRGDTPDEAGFGTDIRLVRRILDILDESNRAGLDARGYWEADNAFTLESILPTHAPDILEGIRRRVEEGRDEVLLAPYNNAAISTMPPDELRAALRWSVSNPWRSGVEDLFGRYTPWVRPQEGTFTPGLIPFLWSEGIEGVVLAYSGYVFTTFSNFVAPLPPEQRYGVTRLRTRPDGPETVLLPCVSVADVLNHRSLEQWMLDLRKLQVDGVVDQDLVIHMNFDADAESWVPSDLPWTVRWMPNAGGLPEYIEYVNKYEWAEFTTPGEFVAGRRPQGEVVVSQDLADGAFDGLYSWAEKWTSHETWTRIEQSRLLERRADALATDVSVALSASERDEFARLERENFRERLLSLSTTHFGMSTPTLNEERQAVADAMATRVRERSRRMLQLLAQRRIERALRGGAASSADYVVEVRDLRDPGRDREPQTTRVASLVRVPLIVPRGPVRAEVRDETGEQIDASLVDFALLDDERRTALLWIRPLLAAGEARRFEIRLVTGSSVEGAAAPLRELRNDRLVVRLAPETGIEAIEADGAEVAGRRFLTPFVSYRHPETVRRFEPNPWQITRPEDETWQGLSRARLETEIPLDTPTGEASVGLRVDLSLPDDAGTIVADVQVDYPYTRKDEVLKTVQQKLRRLLDFRWIEVGPFELRPALDATRERPVRVWKRNYLGVVSHFDLDYAGINPANAELDAFNNQITAGWVAVSDGRRGLLLASDADVRASFAFAPMRLRERNGRQELSLNPFGSYHGEQLDYSHMGGTGLGTAIANVASASIRPNGPSYNGRSERFSLLLAPYEGDAPGAEVQREAEAFHRSPAVVYLESPDRAPVRIPGDVGRIAASLRRRALQTDAAPLAAPRAFLASPTESAVDLVWDAPDDARIDTIEVAWRAVGEGRWMTRRVSDADRVRIASLENGERMLFRIRSAASERRGEWSDPQEVVVGPVGTTDLTTGLDIPAFLMLRLFVDGLYHVLTSP